jgi:hypothetical protein
MESSRVFGPRCSASFASFDPDTSSWRTWQRSLLGDSDEFSETWPRSGMTRSGTAFQLRPLAPLTDVTASGSWPTRKASPSGPDYARANREGSGGDDLATAVARQSFKTPTSAPWSHGGGGGELQKQVNARLTRDGLYTTPTRDDTGYRKEPYAQGGVALSAQAGGPLNPTWVEWLMGFPLDWTALPPSEIPSSRRSRSGSAGASSKRKKDG